MEAFSSAKSVSASSSKAAGKDCTLPVGDQSRRDLPLHRVRSFYGQIHLCASFL